MYAKKIDNEWQLFNRLPASWNNSMPYNWKEIGIKEVVQPTITASQKKGELIYDIDNDVCTYEVLDKTAEEIRVEDLQAAQVVPNLNFKKQLLLEGITKENVLSVIDTLPETHKEFARLSFEEANTFDRSNPFVAMVGHVFNKTSDQMDDIFIAASKMKL